MPKSTTTDQEILEAALIGLQYSLASVDEKIKDLRRQLRGKASGDNVEPASEGATRPKRVMSAAARRRIGAAQKKRWAAFRKVHQK
jgi:hypothetical protein